MGNLMKLKTEKKIDRKRNEINRIKYKNRENKKREKKMDLKTQVFKFNKYKENCQNVINIRCNKSSKKDREKENTEMERMKQRQTDKHTKIR